MILVKTLYFTMILVKKMEKYNFLVKYVKLKKY